MTCWPNSGKHCKSLKTHSSLIQGSTQWQPKPGSDLKRARSSRSGHVACQLGCTEQKTQLGLKDIEVLCLEYPDSPEQTAWARLCHQGPRFLLSAHCTFFICRFCSRNHQTADSAPGIVPCSGQKKEGKTRGFLTRRMGHPLQTTDWMRAFIHSPLARTTSRGTSSCKGVWELEHFSVQAPQDRTARDKAVRVKVELANSSLP